MTIVWELIALVTILGGLGFIFVASHKRKNGVPFENYVVFNIAGFGLCFLSALLIIISGIMNAIALPIWVLYIIAAFFLIFFIWNIKKYVDVKRGK